MMPIHAKKPPETARRLHREDLGLLRMRPTRGPSAGSSSAAFHSWAVGPVRGHQHQVIHVTGRTPGLPAPP